MGPTIMERLARGDVLISDGATGTYLQARGLEPGGCPEELNAGRPGLVRGMAADYFEAGSDMVLTNSFGGNRFMLEKYGYGDRVAEFNRLAAEHARSAAPPGGYVVGSVGPSGEFLEPLGEVTQGEMLEAFVEQVTALEAGGADAVVVETMTALEEAALAVRAVKENTNLTAIATMVFDKGPRGFFTMMGVTPARAAVELRAAGADVVGSNCGNGIEGMLAVAGEMRRATDGYMLIHSNAGLPELRNGEVVYPEGPDWMAERFQALVEAGVSIVGGCCGTTPDHIRALSGRLRG
ncbi:MAG: homocysteine S-methyltransferase family protein [Dehalococcoidia bacterium]|nr:homocysteine S-methyltransferase family protein [Dehalococcoidia bacterium]